MTNPVPRRIAWNRAPSCAGNRRPHGAASRVRDACGWPVRITAIASLSTSTSPAYGGLGHRRDDRAWPPDPRTWGAGPGLPSVDSMGDHNAKIAVYGASGFTGGLVVAELGRQGLSPVLVGRSAERLRKAAVDAGVAGAEVRVAGLD